MCIIIDPLCALLCFIGLRITSLTRFDAYKKECHCVSNMDNVKYNGYKIRLFGNEVGVGGT
jgi:hypothetical protein